MPRELWHNVRMTASALITTVSPDVDPVPVGQDLVEVPAAEQGIELPAVAPGKRFEYDWRQVERGLPLAELEAFSGYSGIPVKAMLEVVIPARTLKHRKQRNESFSMEESDRLARVARVYALTVRVFGGTEIAIRWMTHAKDRFDERTPIEMMRTQAGARQVEELLYQIDEGAFG